MTIINRDSFQPLPDSEQPEHDYWVEGTVDVTLRGETRTVKATENKWGEITAYGMTGRYQTGTKAWPASVKSREGMGGRFVESADFGRDDRSAKFRKENYLSFDD